ncbi:MAG: tetratricopeptide repeat protein [Betaproteobacteria bacterium]|nr:tetratricopeptide repeat protein [Betaproteobacteria bacterium]
MSAALGPFAELVARDERRIDLARACLLIAEDAYPGLEIDRYVGEIERLALRLRARLPAQCDAEGMVVALNRYLFDDLGYRGNDDDYYDPRNSYLNEVIDRRTGIPITLSVVYLEVGRRIGLPLEGVSFPGHFVVRMRLRGGMLVLDPFAAGAPLDQEELRARLRRVIPPAASAPIPLDELPLEQFLEPAGSRQILARILRNLKGIYRDAGQPERMLAVLDRMLVVDPQAHAELRDRGLLYQRLEAHRAALRDIAAYLERAPDAPDAGEMRARMVELAGICARLN